MFLIFAPKHRLWVLVRTVPCTQLSVPKFVILHLIYFFIFFFFFFFFFFTVDVVFGNLGRGVDKTRTPFVNVPFNIAEYSQFQS